MRNAAIKLVRAHRSMHEYIQSKTHTSQGRAVDKSACTILTVQAAKQCSCVLGCAYTSASPQAGSADAGVLRSDWLHDDCSHHSSCACKVSILLLQLQWLLRSLLGRRSQAEEVRAQGS